MRGGTRNLKTKLVFLSCIFSALACALVNFTHFEEDSVSSNHLANIALPKSEPNRTSSVMSSTTATSITSSYEKSRSLTLAIGCDSGWEDALG